MLPGLEKPVVQFSTKVPPRAAHAAGLIERRFHAVPHGLTAVSNGPRYVMRCERVFVNVNPRIVVFGTPGLVDYTEVERVNVGRRQDGL